MIQLQENLPGHRPVSESAERVIDPLQRKGPADPNPEATVNERRKGLGEVFAPLFGREAKSSVTEDSLAAPVDRL
jgi:hypothetical protein